MKKMPKGFTIVELMIVIGVIGIIASIALPIYGDYMKRGKVSEAVQLLAGLRIPMQEYYMSNDAWPQVATVGAKTSGKYTSILVSSTDPDDLYVEATLKGQDDLGGTKIRVVYFPDENEWVCTTNNATPPIPPQYLPTSCK